MPETTPPTIDQLKARLASTDPRDNLQAMQALVGLRERRSHRRHAGSGEPDDGERLRPA